MRHLLRSPAGEERAVRGALPVGPHRSRLTRPSRRARAAWPGPSRGAPQGVQRGGVLAPAGVLSGGCAAPLDRKLDPARPPALQGGCRDRPRGAVPLPCRLEVRPALQAGQRDLRLALPRDSLPLLRHQRAARLSDRLGRREVLHPPDHGAKVLHPRLGLAAHLCRGGHHAHHRRGVPDQLVGCGAGGGRGARAGAARPRLHAGGRPRAARLAVSSRRRGPDMIIRDRATPPVWRCFPAGTHTHTHISLDWA
mmetsp:Transcript_22782/g.73469  ORF Transcript_22782/g.73469 Transcript_22782/m.73469 type:complete len:252 (+) Transcript_22782:696-1451(+)